MKEIVLAYPKEGSELLIIGGHELGLGRWKARIELATSVANLKNVKDIFDRAEALRIQVESTSSFQLFKTSL